MFENLESARRDTDSENAKKARFDEIRLDEIKLA
jgi:hypothetical protein